MRRRRCDVPAAEPHGQPAAAAAAAADTGRHGNQQHTGNNNLITSALKYIANKHTIGHISFIGIYSSVTKDIFHIIFRSKMYTLCEIIY